MKNSVTKLIEQLAETPRRISPEEALSLWKEGDFLQMGLLATAIRDRKNPPKEVSYTVFRIINYTDICEVGCKFCSFQSPLDARDGYLLSLDQIEQKTRETLQRGGDQIFFQGGVNPDIPFEYYLDALKTIKGVDPTIHIRGFSPVEVLALERLTGQPLEKIFERLIEAGLDSFPGAGAEILTERMRLVLSEKKSSPAEWKRAMKAAFDSGLKGSSNIVWGSVETPEEVIEHLALLRDLQDQTGGLLSFVPWTYQQQTKEFVVRHVPAYEYLKMISLSRIFFDNIDHIEVSLLVKGRETGELALRFGADDINSPVLEENVLRSHGLKSEKESVEFIRNAGFTPVRRSFLFAQEKYRA